MSTPTVTPPGWYLSDGAMHWWTGSEWNDGVADASTRPDSATPLVHPNGEPGSYWPPVQPPKNNHTTRKVLLICGGAALALGIGGILAGVSHPKATPVAAPKPTATSVTDAFGHACPALDSAGYCPGDDPAPAQVTDPSGNTCAALDSAGYCPGYDPVPAPVAANPAEAVVLNDGYTASYQTVAVPAAQAAQGITSEADGLDASGNGEFVYVLSSSANPVSWENETVTYFQQNGAPDATGSVGLQDGASTVVIDIPAADNPSL